MRSKKSKIVKQLDPQEVEGVSQARIEHYLSLGYLPYLDEKSHVKWLTQPQMSMRAISSRNTRVRIPHRILPKKQTGRYRKKQAQRSFFHFVQDNWIFALVLLIIVLFLLLAFLDPELIF